MTNILTDKNKLFWILHLSGWILYAILMGTLSSWHLQFSSNGFLLFCLTYFTGLSLTFGLRYFYRKVYDRFRSVLVVLLIIIAASAVITLLWQLVDVLVSLPFITTEDLETWLNRYRPFKLVKLLKLNLVYYLFILIWSVLYFGIRNWFAQMEEKIRAEKALALANKATLQMLRYQINPHFLFNSLNSIQGLMYRDVKKADLMLTELSEFLRFSLKYKTDLYIPLKDEFEILEKYLFIQKIRFDDNLSYEIVLPPELLTCKILCFLTQPLVENAVKHGMKSDPYTGMNIKIKADIEQEQLAITITNSGRWIENDEDGGTGIANVRERLENAYPGHYTLSFTQQEGIVKVTLLLPLQQ
ncbi:MAG: histidine kinase [Bacteroidota bacterium]